MGAYIIKVTNGSDVGTIENQIDVGFRYTDKLNSINESDLKLSGTGSVKRGLLVMGATVEIYRNTVLEFEGIIDNFDTLDAGSMVIHVSGKEIRLVQEKGAYANSPWANVASATINAAIIAESNYFSAGTIETGVDIDFRLAKTQSLWSGLGNLSGKTGQDIQIDYANNEVDILDHRGSSTSVATFNDGIQIKNIRVSTAYPKGNSVKVYGKGDGENQIESDDAQGQDATSKSTYGIIKEVIIDRSIISVAEANRRANIEVAKIKDPTKIYDFECVNPNESVTTGDVLTLNSQDKDLTNEEVRITGKERGIRGGTEYLSLQVANAAFSQLVKTSNEMLGQLEKSNVDGNTYMQGSGNTMIWGAGINAKTDYPLKIGFYIPSAFITDEAGNLTITGMTLDYDIDKYKKEVGTASYTGSDPQVQNTSGNTQPGVSGTSATQTPTATGIVSVWHTIQQVAITAAGYVEENIRGSGVSLYTTRGVTLATNTTGTSVTVDLAFAFPSGNDEYEGNETLNNNATRKFSIGESDSDNDSGWFYAWDDNYAASRWTGTHENVYTHTHGSHSHTDGSYTSDNHSHPDGSYDIDASDLDSISIGDDISEAGSVNATSVNIYLDFWNGSSWVNKHSILNTGATLGSDVDITNSETYPDAAGYWRVRIEPITVTADFVQGIVKIKHNLDN